MRRERADKRQILENGSILHFQGMDCTITDCLGKGSNAIVYKGYYPDHYRKDIKHPVLIKELFPFHPAGRIYRDEENRIRVEEEAREYYEMHRDSFENGNRFHLRVLEAHPSGLDSNVNTYLYQNTLYTLLEFTGGRSLQEEMERTQEPLTLERAIRWMKGMLQVLGLFHELGYLHLDISPDNILLTGEGEQESVTLIDYNSVVSIDAIRQDEEILLSLKEAYAAPELMHADRKRIDTGTDLYAAAAVFFYLLFGRERTRIERKNRFSLPKVSGIPELEKQTPIVLDMLYQILRRGFESLPARRYRSVDEMLRDLEELEDRIRMRGITKWALWQSGYEQVLKTVRDNRAWSYLTGKKEYFPLYAENKEGRILMTHEGGCDPQVLLRKALTGSRKPILLLGGGGMGKTTVFYSMILNQTRTYTAQTPAWVYVSLYGYKSGETTYITDKLLEGLRFQPHTDSMESARHELRHLLSSKMRGNMPVLVLLLDGLNEAEGDTRELFREIEAFMQMEGVVLIAGSRSEAGGEAFETWRMSHLLTKEVREILAEKGILPPQDQETMEMLTIPMMLSMYMQVVEGTGRQNQKLEQKENLVEAYLSSLVEKEKDSWAEEDGFVYGLEAALQYVLPEIAGALQRKKRALTAKEMREVSEKCYKGIASRALTVVFEEWYGHTKEMRLGAGSADEWFGKVILEILWKRLGLLVCVEEEIHASDQKGKLLLDEDGNPAGNLQIGYRIRHQILEEYLVEKNVQFHKEYDRVRLRQKRWGMIAGLGLVSVLSVGFGMYNYRMRSVIARQEEQIAQELTEVQRNESLILAGESGHELEEKNVTNAIQSALDALPKEEERPYVAAAEKALTEAAGVYREPDLMGICRLQTDMLMEKTVPSEDGKYVIAYDRYGNLYGFSGIDGEELWKKTGCAPWAVFSLEEMQAVLYKNREGLELLRLDNGETIWKTVFSEEASPFEIADLASETLNLSEAKDQIAVERHNEDGAWYEFYEAETGELISRTQTYAYQVPQPENDGQFRNQYLHKNGVFSEDGSGFVTFVSTVDFMEKSEQKVPHKTETKYTDGLFALEFAVGSGECLGCRELTESVEISSYLQAVFIGETGEDAGSVLLYNRSEKNDLTYFAGMFGEERYYSKRFGETFAEAPYIFFGEEDILFITEYEILRTTYAGEKIMRIELAEKEKLLFCQELEDESVRLFTEDGSVYTCRMESLERKMNLVGEVTTDFRGLDSSVFYASRQKLPFALKAAFGREDNGAVCIVEFDDPENVYVYDKRGDRNGIRIFGPDLSADHAVLTPLPKGKGYVYTGWDDIEVEENVLLIRNRIGIFDLENRRYEELLDEVLPNSCGNYLGISSDENLLFFQNGTLDRLSGTWTDEEHDDPFFLHTEYDAVLCDPSILYEEDWIIGWDTACWRRYFDTDELKWYLNGEVKTVPFTADGKNIQDIAGNYEGMPQLSSYEIGDNGDLIYTYDNHALLDEDSGFCHRVYTDETKTWQILYDAQGNEYRGEARFALAENSTLMAVAEEDWNIHLFDPVNSREIGTIRMEQPVDMLQEMQFVMDDAFLLLEYEESITGAIRLYLMDVKTGACVWSQRADDPEEKIRWEGIRTFFDRDLNELYIYEENGIGIGLCLDLQSMEVKRTLPRLYDVTDAYVITRAKDNGGLWLYPKYDLKDIYEIGSAWINHED